MPTPQPTILENITPLQFIEYIASEHAAPSALIICSTKEDFLHRLQTSIDRDPDHEVTTLETDNDNDNGDGEPKEANQAPPLKTPSNGHSSHEHPWSTPTLRLLSKSSTLKLAFCPDVTHLRAYLATYSTLKARNDGSNNSTETSRPKHRILAILDLIALHRPTSSFSAQGLNRSLAMAVEAAHHSSSRLLIAECSTPGSHLDREADPGADGAVAPTLGPAFDPAFGPAVLSGSEAEPKAASPWDEAVSILNVTTKSFGAGERGWVGRTVKVRTIAERWFCFRDGVDVLRGKEKVR